MHIAILRAMPGESISMDVYADGLVAGLRAIQPELQITEVAPYPLKDSSSWTMGLRKYYERFWHFPRTIVKQKVNIFHIIDHSYGHLAYWLRGTEIPIVVTCHDLINLTYPEDLNVQARLPLISAKAWQFSVQGMHQADHIVAVSSFTATDIVQKLNIASEQITVVPDAVESLFRSLPQKEVESFRRKHNISPETMCLLHVGSVQPRKNVLTILKVVEALKNKGLSVCFLKAGADFTDEQKVYMQAYGIENDVVYLGKVDKDILVKAYNAANMFLFPSLHEGFGMPILEAMACGTPVITSNASSMPEVAGDAAILVEPTDVQAIVEAVLRLWKDSVYQELLIDRGFARVKAFTWEAVAEQVCLIYNNILNKKGF